MRFARALFYKKAKITIKTYRQPVILSEVELLRVERKRTSKSARLFSRSGISKRIWLAFEAM